MENKDSNHMPNTRNQTRNTKYLKLSGLEPLIITPESNYINVGERTNVAGSKKFLRLIKEEKYSEALDIARDQVDGGAQILDVNFDDGLLDGKYAMVKFCFLAFSIVTYSLSICRFKNLTRKSS